MAGIMWYTYDKPGQLNIRHSCEHGDRLPQYGWIRHDGTGFGQQRIVDHSRWYGVWEYGHVLHVCISKPRPPTDMIIETDFLTMANASLGETWTVRIRGKPRQPLSQQPVLASLIVYLYNEGRGEMAYHLSGQRSVEEVYGHTPKVITMATIIVVGQSKNYSQVQSGCVSVCISPSVSAVQDVPASQDGCHGGSPQLSLHPTALHSTALILHQVIITSYTA